VGREFESPQAYHSKLLTKRQSNGFQTFGNRRTSAIRPILLTNTKDLEIEIGEFQGRGAYEVHIRL
jgi:hypothetical protein